MNADQTKAIILSENYRLNDCKDRSNDLVNLTGGHRRQPLIADSLIYRLTFDPEGDDDNDDDDYYYQRSDYGNQLYTISDNLKCSSIDINDNYDNMINVQRSSDRDNNNQLCTDHYDDDLINELGLPLSKLMSDSMTTINLNVSTLADEIIESEMNSLKVLQAKIPLKSAFQTTSTVPTATTIKTHGYDETSGHYANHDDGIDDDYYYDGDCGDKLTGRYAVNRSQHWRSLILPPLMRETVNTETSPIISSNCPTTMPLWTSCCVIS